MEVSAIDVFCGIGGLSKGLQQAGINVNLGLDFDKSCQYAYESNLKAPFLHKDVKDADLIQTITPYWANSRVKILAGCAPCQPFSTHSNKNKEKENSDKWNLISYFFKIVQETRPEILTMENVTNLGNQQIFKDFVADLEEEGYYVSYKNVYCPDYGVPQKRRRLVLLASRLGEIKLIDKTHNKPNYKTVKEAIGHLPKIKNGETHKSDLIHKASEMKELNLRRIRASIPGGTWKDWSSDLLLDCHKKSTGKSYKSVYGRMKWNEPSPTITTQFYNYGTGRFGHPSQDRALSIREAAILQTFPDDYTFIRKEDESSVTTLGRHIGNAVPPKLGEVVGKSILKHLEEYGKK